MASATPATPDMARPEVVAARAGSCSTPPAMSPAVSCMRPWAPAAPGGE